MLEKLLLKELNKRIRHRFKLRGESFNTKEADKYLHMISKEIVNKILDELIDPVETQRGWWCHSCHDFVPGEEVCLDQDEYLHIPKKGTCKGDCHTVNIGGGK